MLDKLNKISLAVAAMYAVAYAVRSESVRLRHFKAADFGIWWPFMSAELLHKLDEFAEWFQGRPIISPASGALGRLTGSESSQHYPSPLINAADLMLPGIALRDAVDAARFLGFHGIGIYPDWSPHHGIHLDMRPDRSPSNPATSGLLIFEAESMSTDTFYLSTV